MHYNDASYFINANDESVFAVQDRERGDVNVSLLHPILTRPGNSVLTAEIRIGDNEPYPIQCERWARQPRDNEAAIGQNDAPDSVPLDDDSNTPDPPNPDPGPSSPVQPTTNDSAELEQQLLNTGTQSAPTGAWECNLGSGLALFGYYGGGQGLFAVVESNNVSLLRSTYRVSENQVSMTIAAQNGDAIFTHQNPQFSGLDQFTTSALSVSGNGGSSSGPSTCQRVGIR